MTWRDQKRGAVWRVTEARPADAKVAKAIHEQEAATNARLDPLEKFAVLAAFMAGGRLTTGALVAQSLPAFDDQQVIVVLTRLCGRGVLSQSSEFPHTFALTSSGADLARTLVAQAPRPPE